MSGPYSEDTQKLIAFHELCNIKERSANAYYQIAYRKIQSLSKLIRNGRQQLVESAERAHSANDKNMLDLQHRAFWLDRTENISRMIEELNREHNNAKCELDERTIELNKARQELVVMSALVKNSMSRDKALREKRRNDKLAEQSMIKHFAKG